MNKLWLYIYLKAPQYFPLHQLSQRQMTGASRPPKVSGRVLDLGERTRTDERRVVTGPLQEAFDLCWGQLSGSNNPDKNYLKKFLKAFHPKYFFCIRLLIIEMSPLGAHPALSFLKRHIKAWEGSVVSNMPAS